MKHWDDLPSTPPDSTDWDHLRRMGAIRVRINSPGTKWHDKEGTAHAHPKGGYRVFVDGMPNELLDYGWVWFSWREVDEI